MTKHYLEIDNFGGGDCAYLAYSIGLIPLLKQELTQAVGVPTPLLDKLQALFPQNVSSTNPCFAGGWEQFKLNIQKFDFRKQEQHRDFLNQFNLLLRQIVYVQNVAEIETWAHGGKEVPKTISDAQALFNLYLNPEERSQADVLNTDIGLDIKILNKIKSLVPVYIQDVYSPIKSRLDEELFKKWPSDAGEDANTQRKDLLCEKFYFDDFNKEGNVYKNFIFTLMISHHLSQASIELVDLYIDHIKLGAQRDKQTTEYHIGKLVQRYIENGEIPSIIPEDEQEINKIKNLINEKLISDESRTWIEKYITIRSSDFNKRFIDEFSKKSNLNDADKEWIFNKYLAYSLEGGDTKQIAERIKESIAISSNPEEDSLLKQLFQAKTNKREWGTAEELGTLTRFFDIAITQIKNDTPIRINFGEDNNVPSLHMTVRNKSQYHWVTNFEFSLPEGTKHARTMCSYFDEYAEGEKLTLNEIKNLFVSYLDSPFTMLRSFISKNDCKEHATSIVTECGKQDATVEKVMEKIDNLKNPPNFSNFPESFSTRLEYCNHRNDAKYLLEISADAKRILCKTEEGEDWEDVAKLPLSRGKLAP